MSATPSARTRSSASTASESPQQEGIGLQEDTDHSSQRREKEKAEWRAQTEALSDICRQSLEEDRRVAAERRRAERQHQKTADDDGAKTHRPGAPPSLNTDVTTPPESARPSLASGPLGLPLEGATTDEDFEVFRTVPEEDEDDAEEEVDEDDPDAGYHDDTLPWHHVQLYQLYGRHADYFLHPKIETEKKAVVTLNPRLRAIGGRAGAGTLWTVLRNESRARLLNQDNKLLSPELKSTFGAFAREGLTKKRQPVRRNYLSTEDVPELARLMDQSKVYNAQDFRHKVELMFRSSNINKDRTKVLLYNNPPPDLNNREGEESVGRYMPSWADADQQWDKESELSYKKWLTGKSSPSQPSTGDHTARSSLSDKPRPAATKPHPAAPPPRRAPDKYVFLTEAAATVPGEFSKRRREDAERRTRPQAHGGGDGATDGATPGHTDTEKAASAMAKLGGGDYSLASSPAPPPSPRRRRPTTELSAELAGQWEPLSLHALREYKQDRPALGNGAFNHGNAHVWATGM